MSRYIKLEDAIHNINLEVTGRKEYTGDMKANLFFIDQRKGASRCITTTTNYHHSKGGYALNAEE